MESWEKYRYKNLTFLAVSLMLAAYLFSNETVHGYLLHLGGFGYLGAFISGIFFVSTFTAAPAILVFLVLAEVYSPIYIGLIAGAGAMIGDLLIFKYTQDSLEEEVTRLYSLLDRGHHVEKVFCSKYFSWTLPVIGAFLIASPLPDEIGVSLMGLSKMSLPKFLALAFVLNSVGIFLLVSASVFIKP